MKSTTAIMREIIDSCEGSEDENDVRASKYIKTNLGEIQKCMLEYGKVVLEEAERSIKELNTVNTPEDGLWALATVGLIKKNLK